MSAYYSIYAVHAVGNTQVFSSVNFIIGWSLNYGCVHMSIHEYFTLSQKCILHELSSYCQIDSILVNSLYIFYNSNSYVVTN
jgi:hypothetical protein